MERKYLLVDPEQLEEEFRDLGIIEEPQPGDTMPDPSSPQLVEELDKWIRNNPKEAETYHNKLRQHETEVRRVTTLLQNSPEVRKKLRSILDRMDTEQGFASFLHKKGVEPQK